MANAWQPRARRPLLAIACVVWCESALAQTQQEGLAETLFREGRESMGRGQPDRACPQFEESYRLDPSLGTLLNLGLCYQERGQLATAWTKFRQFVDSAPQADPRLPFASKRIAALELQLPRLRVTLPNGHAPVVVRLDGVELRSASLGVALPVDPGEHVLKVSLVSGESSTTRLSLAVAERAEVTALVPMPTAPASAPVAPSPKLKVSRESSSASAKASARPTIIPRSRSHSANERAWALGLGAVGLAGLVSSGIWGVSAWHEKTTVRAHCPDHQCRDQVGVDAARRGARDEILADVTLMTGVLAAVAATALWWHSSRASIVIEGGPRSAGISYQYRLK